MFVLSKDQTTLVEFNINNQNLTVIPSIQLNSTKIIQLYSVYNHLVFHTDDNQIHLWWNENEPIKQLEKASRLITKDNRLILACTDNKTIVLYDLKEKLRRTIQLDDDVGQCEALAVSDNNQEYDQYLFIICDDRLLRMYRVSDGKQIAKLFIHTDLHTFIGIINNRVLLKVANRLCIIKIIDKHLLPQR